MKRAFALGALLVLAGCTSVDEPLQVSWASLGLPARFDYACDVGHGHERYSIDLERRLWADPTSGLQTIDSIEPRRILLADGRVGSNSDYLAIDPMSGAYMRETHMADPVMAWKSTGECHLGRFTPFEARIESAVQDLVDRGYPLEEARSLIRSRQP